MAPSSQPTSSDPESSISGSGAALPSWSVRPVGSPEPTASSTAAASSSSDGGGPSRGILLGGGALTAAIVVLAGVAMWTGAGRPPDNSGPVITAPETPAVESADSAVPSTSTAETDPDVDDAPSAPLPLEDADDVTDTDDGAPISRQDLARSSDRRALVSGGVVYLSGPVPSRAIADAIVAKAAAVMGAENVVDQYVIDPSVPFDPTESAPLYVEDLVLFPTGSAEVSPQFRPLLDLGVVLMSQNPQVTIDVIGHTDSIGSIDDNLALSQARVDAVVEYWVAAGIDRDRIRAIGVGESQPIADNTTPDGKQINRRVEFIITGLLDE